jgi:hypothetical protein
MFINTDGAKHDHQGHVLARFSFQLLMGCARLEQDDDLSLAIFTQYTTKVYPPASKAAFTNRPGEVTI